MEHYVFDIFSCDQMNEFGLKIAKNVPNGTVIALVGNLGAGKTTLVRGVARGLNITEVVQSPTFNIMKLYLKGNRPLIHIDAYRLADINTDIGLDEYIGYETGITMIDAMTPIGRGQRELIIGDRQTGKTAIAIDAIINQKGKNVLCIYVAIGQKNSTVAQIVDKLKSHGAMEYTLVMAATASEPAPMLYVAPYAGCAMAEEWMEQGKDVLIIYDDLSKHAVAYRALSLLLKRSPGREAYPGDVFYLHSRLLERACKLSDEFGGGSITALPIVETQSGDISAYIPTNVISITDGQIFLTTDLFNAGQRPAIDSGLSVSRVGGAAQFKATKQVARSLKIDLASFLEMKSFSQFGSDLDKSTLAILKHGEVLLQVLRQEQYKVRSLSEQVFGLFLAKTNKLDDLPIEEVSKTVEAAHQYVKNNHPNILKDIDNKKELSEETENALNKAIDDFFQISKK